MWWLLIAIVGLPVLGALFERWAGVVAARRFPAPGRFVEAGGLRLHVNRTGSGAPSVILEAGLGASSISWCLLQPKLAAHATVCSYDRAGLGWSEPSASPRTASNSADELLALLEADAVPPPWIFVAHSAGAFTVQLMAARNPGRVAGLVLVDPVSTEEFSPLSPAREKRMRGGSKLCRRCARLARVGFVRLFLHLVYWTGAARLADWGLFLSSGRVVRGGERIASALRQLPPGVPETLIHLWSQPVFYRTIAAQIEGLVESARQVQENPVPSSIPLTVISAGAATPSAVAAHRRLAARSARGEHITAEQSDHFVMLDQPGLIVEAVRKMAEEMPSGT